MNKYHVLPVSLALGFALLPWTGRAAGAKSSDPTVAAKLEAEAGAQDPAGFPRPTGLARKSYSANRGAVRTEEVATYHASAGVDDVTGLYRAAAKAAGWAEGAHSDSGAGFNLLRIIDWSMPAKEAEVRFYAVKAGGTDLWVRVFTYNDKASPGAKPAATGIPPAVPNSPAATKMGAANSKLTGAAPVGPPPTQLSVLCDGDAASHLISWQATSWASFDVFREDASGWVQIGDKITDTSLHESALVPPKTKYKVTVRHTDGSEGSLEYVWADPPQPGTVEGLAASQTAPGKIRVTWKPLRYATKFRVFVSNVSSNGELVTGTACTLTEVPAGNCTVRVAPCYTIATGEELRFGNAWVDVPVYGDRFRIVLLGVECVHETSDNPLQTDGKHDEIFAGAYVATVKPLAPIPSPDDHRGGPPGAAHPPVPLDHHPGPNQVQDNGSRGMARRFERAAALQERHSTPVPVGDGFVRTKVMGDTNGFASRIRAGSASDWGGIQTGDFVPSSAIIAPQPGVAATSDRFPLLIWEGDLTSKSDYLAVAPVLFEWDQDDEVVWNSWKDWWVSPNGLAELGFHAKDPGAGLFRIFSETVDSDEEEGGRKLQIWLAPGFSQDGNRPVGLDGDPALYYLIPRGLLLNRDNLDAALGGKSAVVIKEELNDQEIPLGPQLMGKYTLYIQLEHVLPPATQAVAH